MSQILKNSKNVSCHFHYSEVNTTVENLILLPSLQYLDLLQLKSQNLYFENHEFNNCEGGNIVSRRTTY